MNKTEYSHRAGIAPLCLLIVAASLSLFLQGCGGEEANSESGSTDKSITVVADTPLQAELERLKVVVEKIEPRALVRQIEMTGTVESKTEVDIQPKISETIKDVFVEEGDSVQAQQLMAMLNRRELELEVARDKAHLESAQAKLSELLAGTRSEDIDCSRSTVDRAKAAYDNLLRNKERYETLHKKDILTDKDYDDFVVQLQQAKQDLDIAKATLLKCERGPRQEEIANARASVAAASAELSLTKEKLSHTEIKAPLAGVVSMRNAEVGQKVDPGTVLFSMYDDTVLRIAVNVNERDVGHVQREQKAQIVATSYPGVVFDGVVEILGERLDVATRTLPVKVRLLTGMDKLLPGMFAKVTIRAGQYDNAIVISRDSMRFKEGRPTAFVYENGRAKERILELGQAKDGDVKVQSGLEAGELLITSNIDDLIDDEEVELVDQLEGVNG